MKVLQPKTPIKYYGGKQLMLGHILPLIPAHKSYTEPFFGGGAVFFAKPKSDFEVVNDTNGELINFYRVLQNNFPALKVKVNATLHSRKLHAAANSIYNMPELFDEVTRAWAVWVMSIQGFAGKLDSCWGFNKTSQSQLSKRISNAKYQFQEYLKERLEAVQIECTDALEIISKYDSPEAFHYCDPPYYNSSLGHYGGYNKQDFEALLLTLSNCKGKFLLSSYPSDLLTEFTTKHGWYTKEVNKTVAISGRVSKKKTEVLTANYKL